MRALAVDTTTPRGSVAVVEGDDVAAELRLRSEVGHSDRLLPAVDFLLRGLGLSPADIEGYAVATGPGSFTGLRVGISTVQGLALASGRPCLGVPALDALAWRLRGTAAHLVAMMDAYRGEVFGAVYDAQAALKGERLVLAPEAFLACVPEEAAFLGDGALRYRDLILAARPRAAFPERSLFLAGTIGRMAVPRLVAGEGGPPDALRPFYLRPVDIRKAAP